MIFESLDNRVVTHLVLEYIFGPRVFPEKIQAFGWRLLCCLSLGYLQVAHILLPHFFSRTLYTSRSMTSGCRFCGLIEDW